MSGYCHMSPKIINICSYFRFNRLEKLLRLRFAQPAVHFLGFGWDFIIACPNMDAQMTIYFGINIAHHPFDVHRFLLLHYNFRFSIIHLSELISFILDSKSCYHRKCFSIGRLLRFSFQDETTGRLF